MSSFGTNDDAHHAYFTHPTDPLAGGIPMVLSSLFKTPWGLRLRDWSDSIPAKVKVIFPREVSKVGDARHFCSGSQSRKKIPDFIYRITRPVSVARKVMEESPHSMLTGEGATSFAVSKGFVIDQELMKFRESRAEDRKSGPDYVCTVHDTLGLLALDTSGNVCSGVTTSGKPNKHPGRVGDSALPGCGFYADSTAGAACCTGDGDEILKFCPSFLAVQYMKQGLSPEEACSQVIKDIIRKLSESSKSIEMAILALNIKGEHGASATFTEWRDPLTGDIYNGFPYTLWHEGNQSVQTVLVKARD